MSSIFSQLNFTHDETPQLPDAPVKEKRSVADGKAAGGITRALRSQRVYEITFSEPRTVSSASAEMGISHVGCLNQCYRYERRGLIRRVGSEPCGSGGRAIVWQWIKK